MSKHLEIEQQAAAWLARKDSERWTASEQTQLDQWLAMATAHRVAYLRLAAAWRKADRVAPAAPLPETAPQALPRFSPWRVAAALLVTAGAAAFLLGGRAKLAEARYETALGAHQMQALKDGSRLTLNTATLVRARVSQTERTVWLDKGEVYFEVAHDTAHPFVVIAGANRITVLGTKFAVRRDAGKIDVLVVDGRVRVENGQAAADSAVVLGKHQQVVATAAAMVTSEASDAGIEQRLGWREGKLIFDQATLGYAAGEFNRYNKTKLVMADAEAAKVEIGGRFDVGNVKGFTHLLQQGLGLDVRENGDTITVASHRPRRAGR